MKIRSYWVKKNYRMKMSSKVFFKFVALALLMSVTVLISPRSLYLFDSNVEKFSNIKKRIIEDKRLVEKTCARYLGSLDPWLPVIPPKNGICGMCYYIEENKKLGHCANAKVIDFYHSVSFTVLESFLYGNLSY